MTPKPLTDVKRLLAEATPLPWDRLGQRIIRGLEGIARCESDGGNLADGWLTEEQIEDEEIANAILIVHAVNTLPDYEAAVDALDDMIHRFNPQNVQNAIAVLRRLRKQGEGFLQTGAAEADSEPYIREVSSGWGTAEPGGEWNASAPPPPPVEEGER